MEPKDNTHLRLVSPSSETDAEFLPLPHFGWLERPSHVPLTQDECATALYLARGDLTEAADLLKVSPLRLEREVKRSPRLTSLRDDMYSAYHVARASKRVIEALDAEDPRVTWAAAIKILSSKAAAGHPLSPAGDGGSSSSVTINQDNREITFHWRRTVDKAADEVVENSFDEENSKSDD